MVQGSASSSPAGTWRGKRWTREGSFPGFSCKPKVRSAGFWHRQAQRNRDCGSEGAGQVGADPRLGRTQGAWVRQGLSLTFVILLCRTRSIVFLRLLPSNPLRSDGAVTNSYHVMKTYKSVISHSKLKEWHWTEQVDYMAYLSIKAGSELRSWVTMLPALGQPKTLVQSVRLRLSSPSQVSPLRTSFSLLPSK